MSIPTDTENAVVYLAAMEATVPQPVEPGKVYVVPSSSGGRTTIDLTGDEYRDFPARKRGTVTVEDVASFAQYYDKHAHADSEVYADLDTGVITAVLDAHLGTGEAARWQEFRLILRLTPTPQWTTWNGRDRIYMRQLDFAEFLEDNLVDIASEPVPAAELLEIATTFQAKSKVSYASSTVLSSGAITLNYEETSDASGGAKGQLVVPKKFAIGIAPFDDVDPYKVEARFRHRIESSALKLCYILERPQDVLRDAVKTVVGQVEEACGIKVMRGSVGS